MKSILRRLFTFIQYGIIVSAVLLTVLRFAVPHLAGYENKVEAWFQQQNIKAELSSITLNFDGYSPEVFIKGLKIKDDNNQELISLDRAVLHLNLWQSVLKQQVVVDKADVYLSKTVIHSELFNDMTTVSDEPLLSSDLINVLIGLKGFSLYVEQIDFVTDAQKTYPIYQSLLTLKGEGSHKIVSLSSSLLQQKTTMLNAQVALDFTQLSDDKGLKGDGFIAINAPSLSAVNLPSEYAFDGQFSLKQWFEFNGENISSLAQIEANALSFKVDNVTHKINADSLLSIENNSQRLTLFLDNNVLALNNVDLKAVTLSAQTEDFTQYLVAAENLAIANIKKLAASWVQLKTINQYTKALQPKGDIKKVLIQIPSLQQLEQTQIQLAAKDVQWKAYKGIPALNKIDVNVVANQYAFNAQVSSKGLTLLPADFYSQPFSVEAFQASVDGRISKEGVLIDVPKMSAQQQGATLKGRLNLSILQNESPYMFLRVQGQEASIKTVRPFLPQRLMDEDVLHWVKDSVKQAQVKTADVLYAGRLENDVNFDPKQNGIFETALNVEDLDLWYDSRWPSVQAKQVDVSFKNYQLRVNSALAHAMGLKAKQIVFNIKDLNQSRATLSLNLNDTVKKQWAFLQKSPLRDEIPFSSDVTELAGDVKTEVSAEFPLDNEGLFKPRYTVKLKSHKAGFSLKPLGVNFTGLSADIQLTQDVISLAPAKVKWFGQDVTFSIDNNEDSIHLKMQGADINVASLLTVVPKSINKHFVGNSSWEVNAFIHQDDPQKPLVTIEAHSGLKGTAILLPAPLSLAKEETKSLRVAVEFDSDEAITIRTTLDKQVDMRLKLQKNNDESYGFWGANVQFGEQLALTQIKNSVQVKGEINELNIDHWQSYLTPENIEDESQDKTDYLSLIHSMDIFIKQLHVKNVEAKDSKLVLAKTENGLSGVVQSSVAEGRFFIPIKQDDKTPLTIDLDSFNIVIKEGLGSNVKQVYQTKTIPNLTFKSKKLAVNGKLFSDALIEIESHKDNEFNLKTLTLNHRDIKLNASGKWLFNKASNQNVSQLKITIKGKKIGQTLDELGMGKSIENGEIDFNGELIWPSSFWSLDLAQAKGSAKIKLKDGYLLDVDPAGGRFVGLLSLSALPRRLTLDFSDFFKKGLEFDKIKGDFLIKDGNMWTENLKLTSSVSDIYIVGRTGLAVKDYDQVITIIPQVRDTLPVLGSLVAGSSVGWAMLLFQRLFKDPIDDSVSIKYKVTGFWDKPIIELIEKPKLKLETEDNDL